MLNRWFRSKKMWLILICVVSFCIFSVLPTLAVTSAQVHETASAEKAAGDSGTAKWGLIAMALSAGLGCIAAGIAVASVGAAAVGATAEKPGVFGKTLILVGLAEGIAIYGLIIAIMIYSKV